MNGGGFVITVDAFMGITLLFGLVLLAFFFISQSGLLAWNAVDLRAAVNDEAVSLQKSLVLENAIKQSSSELLSSALNSSVGVMCFDASVTDLWTSQPVLYAIKNGCGASSGDVLVVNRAIAVRTDAGISFYLVKVGGWVK